MLNREMTIKYLLNEISKNVQTESTEERKRIINKVTKALLDEEMDDYIIPFAKTLGFEVKNEMILKWKEKHMEKEPSEQHGGLLLTRLAEKYGWEPRQRRGIDWAEWSDYIGRRRIPGSEVFKKVRFEGLPYLGDEIIEGMLRVGRKLTLRGPSKAGKTWALIELAIALSEGGEWLGHKCSKSKVLYLNLEVRSEVFYHRVDQVYKALGYGQEISENFAIINLRGFASTLQELLPDLIMECRRGSYDVIIIDPLYKVLDGDENSNTDMARFCQSFDQLSEEGDVSVIYSHHHRKAGAGLGKSHNAASGAGVLNRDPDVIIDLFEVDLNVEQRKKLAAQEAQLAQRRLLEQNGISTDDIREEKFGDFISRIEESHLELLDPLRHEEETAMARSEYFTGWKVVMDLREFPTPLPTYCYFAYPIHKFDDNNIIGEKDAIRMNKKDPQNRRVENWKTAFEELEIGGKAPLGDMAAKIGISSKTVKDYIKSPSKIKSELSAIFDIDEEYVILKPSDNEKQ